MASPGPVVKSPPPPTKGKRSPWERFAELELGRIGDLTRALECITNALDDEVTSLGGLVQGNDKLREHNEPSPKGPKEQVKAIEKLLHEHQYEEALAAYLRLESRPASSYILRDRLFEHFSRLWGADDNDGDRSTASDCDASDCDASTREEVSEVYIWKRLKTLQSRARMDTASVDNEGDENNNSMPGRTKALKAIRHVDMIEKIVLDELRADLPLLVGKGPKPKEVMGSAVHAFDVVSLTHVLDEAYLACIGKGYEQAAEWVMALTARSEQADRRSLPLCFWDNDQHEELDPPHIGETLLVVNVDEAAPKVGGLRWRVGTVIDKPEPRSMGSPTNESLATLDLGGGPCVRLEDSGDILPLHGNFYVRPSTSTTSPTSEGHDYKYQVDERVLFQDDLGAFYLEGVVVKVVGGHRPFCVQLEGSTSGKWVSGDVLLPGPSHVKTWKLLRSIMKKVMKLPAKVYHTLVQGVITPPAITKLSPRKPTNQGAETGTEELWLDLMDHGVLTALNFAWSERMADLVFDLHRSLLVSISKVFLTDLPVETNERSGGCYFKPQWWIKALYPMLGDIAHFLTISALGCHGASLEQETPTTILRRNSAATAFQVEDFANQTGGFRTSSPQKEAGTGTPKLMTPAENAAVLRLRAPSISMPNGVNLPSKSSEKMKQYPAIIGSILSAFHLEVKHLCDRLRPAMVGLKLPVDMTYIADVISAISFLRGAWDLITHRLDATLAKVQVDDNMLAAFSHLSCRVSRVLNQFQSDILERVLNLHLHWCRTHLLADLHAQDWSTDHMQQQGVNVGCTYGILAWNLFLRGLCSDFRSCLQSHYGAGEVLELLSSILCQTMGWLTTRYFQAEPTRSRLAQYTSDIAAITVIGLSFCRFLQSRATITALGVTANPSLLDDRLPRLETLFPDHGQLFEASLHPHDGCYQTTRANLALVENYCQALLTLLCILQAPADLLVWYLKVSQGKRGAKKETEAKVYPLTRLEHAFVTIQIDRIVEDLQAKLESPDKFNPLTEYRNLGWQTEAPLLMYPSPAAMDAMNNDAAGPRSEGYIVLRSDLGRPQLAWREILLNANPLQDRQLAHLMLRRYELNESDFPLLTKLEMANRRVLLDALGAFDLYHTISSRQKEENSTGTRKSSVGSECLPS